MEKAIKTWRARILLRTDRQHTAPDHTPQDTRHWILLTPWRILLTPRRILLTGGRILTGRRIRYPRAYLHMETHSTTGKVTIPTGTISHWSPWFYCNDFQWNWKLNTSFAKHFDMDKLFKILWRGRKQGRCGRTSLYLAWEIAHINLVFAYARELSKVCSYRSPWQKL